MLTEKDFKTILDSEMRAWNEGDLSFFDKYTHPDFVRHEVGIQEDVVGIEANKANLKKHTSAFPDFHLTIDEVIVHDDTVFSRWTITGTHTMPLEELPPTGKKINISGATLAHFSKNKLIDNWVYYNQSSIFQQLGFTMVPPDMMVEH